ncbi:MAG: cupredoxin domain-containing protein, partial [Actinomycetota bacterium]
YALGKTYKEALLRRFIALVIFAAALGLPASVSAAEVALEAADNKFVPQTLDAAVGDTLVLKNTGKGLHNLVAKDGSFKSKDVTGGQETTVQITKAGAISFVCTYHEALGMKGTLKVAAGGGSGNAPAAPAADEEKAEKESESSKATEDEKAEEEKGEEDTEATAEKPPVEKYFPPVAGLLMLLMFPLIGLAWRKQMKPSSAAKPEPAPPAEE